MEEDHEFVYLALEKCKATLSDAMQVCVLAAVATAAKMHSRIATCGTVHGWHHNAGRPSCVSHFSNIPHKPPVLVCHACRARRCAAVLLALTASPQPLRIRLPLTSAAAWQRCMSGALCTAT